MSSKPDEIDFKGIKCQGVTWYKKVSQKRFKPLPNGYLMDRWMFQLAMFLTFGWLFFVAHSHNYNLDYYKCINPAPYDTGELCKNPFYKPDQSWKGQEFLPPGEYGQKPGPLFQSVIYVPILLFMISGTLNHLFHNRRKAS